MNQPTTGLGSRDTVEKRSFLSSQVVPADGEAKIWARLIESQPDDLTPEAAMYLLRLGFTKEDQLRMQELADRSEEATLTESEAREFDT